MLLKGLGPNHWFIDCMEVVTSFLLLGACYALHKGEAFELKDATFHHIFQIAAIVTLLIACFGFVSSTVDLPTWHVFATAPRMMVSCAALLALGYTVGRRFPPFAAAIYLISGYYALLQIPAFYVHLVQPHADSWYQAQFGLKPTPLPHPDRDFILGALAGGKIMFVLFALAIWGALDSGRERLVSWLLLFINIALSIGLAIFKIWELVRGTWANS